MAAAHFRPCTESKLLLFFARRCHSLYSLLSLNITREICQYLGFFEYFPVLLTGKIALYHTASGAVTTIPLAEELSKDVVCCVIDEAALLGVCCTQHRSYVFCDCGGRFFTPEDDTVKSVEFASGKVRTERPMVHKRIAPGVIRHKAFVWVFGSLSIESGRTCEKFSLREGEWYSLPEMSALRGDFTPAEYQGNIYLSSGSLLQQQTEEFSPSTEQFRLLPLRVTLTSTSIAYIDRGELVVVGGGEVGVWRVGSEECELFVVGETTVICNCTVAPVRAGDWVFWSDQALRRFHVTTKTFYSGRGR